MEKKKFILDIQFFATSGSGGKIKNGRTSRPKMLGIKVHDGQEVSGGSIIRRQRGFEVKAGDNIGVGRDYTLFAKVNGIVKYYTKKKRTFVKIA
jgi:large subunit ribosomal protein L27